MHVCNGFGSLAFRYRIIPVIEKQTGRWAIASLQQLGNIEAITSMHHSDPEHDPQTSKPMPLQILKPLHIIFWRSIAISSLILACIGVLLPVLPTVPFLIVAAWAGNKGWSQLERWLLEHPMHGPIIQGWRHNRAIPRQAKKLAMVMMSVSALLLFFSSVAAWIKIAVPTVMVAIIYWLWHHPDK